jgi:uncharacterized membrane protein YhaH (DUF805 family)
MQPWDYYLKVWRNYVTFEGRARRSEYWYFVLFNLIAAIVLVLLDAALFRNHGWLVNLYGLAAFLPGLAVAVRRLHDIGRSGWWYLIGFVPLVGAIVLLVFFVTDSDPAQNAYGPNPKTEAPFRV